MSTQGLLLPLARSFSAQTCSGRQKSRGCSDHHGMSMMLALQVVLEHTL